MTRVRYVGPHDAVDVPALGRSVARGEEVEASVDAGKALLEQADNWQAVKTATKKEV